MDEIILTRKKLEEAMLETSAILIKDSRLGRDELIELFLNIQVALEVKLFGSLEE